MWYTSPHAKQDRRGVLGSPSSFFVPFVPKSYNSINCGESVTDCDCVLLLTKLVESIFQFIYLAPPLPVLINKQGDMYCNDETKLQINSSSLTRPDSLDLVSLPTAQSSMPVTASQAFTPPSPMTD